MRSDEIDWRRTVDTIDELIGNGHPTDALVRVSGAFENLLKVLYGRIAVRLPPQSVRDVGETLGRKSVDDLGLGALCGLFSSCKLYGYLEGDRAADLSRILKNDLPDLAERRNRNVHDMTEATPADAELAFLQLKRALGYAGLLPHTLTRQARRFNWWPAAVIILAIGLAAAFLVVRTLRENRSGSPAAAAGGAPAAVPPVSALPTAPPAVTATSPIATSSTTTSVTGRPVAAPSAGGGVATDAVGRGGTTSQPATAAPPGTIARSVHPPADRAAGRDSAASDRGAGRQAVHPVPARDPKCVELDVKVAQGQLLTSAQRDFRSTNCGS